MEKSGSASSPPGSEFQRMRDRERCGSSRSRMICVRTSAHRGGPGSRGGFLGPSSPPVWCARSCRQRKSMRPTGTESAVGMPAHAPDGCSGRQRGSAGWEGWGSHLRPQIRSTPGVGHGAAPRYLQEQSLAAHHGRFAPVDGLREGQLPAVAQQHWDAGGLRRTP